MRVACDTYVHDASCILVFDFYYDMRLCPNLSQSRTVTSAVNKHNLVGVTDLVGNLTAAER